MIRVSIGMPVYNGENFIEAALRSILAQTCREFELVVSDNASTDRTEDICRAYASLYPRIRYYRGDHNIGPARNANRTFLLSSGPYFKLAAHDDVLAPDFIEKCAGVLDRDPGVVLAYPLTMWIDEQFMSRRWIRTIALFVTRRCPHT